MKQSLVVIFLSFLSNSSFSQTTNYWPAALGPMPTCNTIASPPTSSCTIVAKPTGGDWNNTATWLDKNGSPAGRIPSDLDVVCIPTGVTVNMNSQPYNKDASCPPISTANSPKLRIFVCGNIQFDNSGKLFLACFSFIQVYANGHIFPPSSGNGSSDQIQIGANIVWGGPASGSQPPVDGPWVLSWPYIGAGVLPVAFDYFKAEQKQPYTIKLDWATLQEVNNTDFIVERSADQRSWLSIGIKKSAGNSSSRFAYTFNDNNPISGYNYYRIRQVDIDGKTSFSEIVRVNNQVKKNISVFPNPVNSTAQLYSKVNFNPAQSIQLIDARGSRVKTINANGSNSMQIDMTSLVSGLYLLQVVENGRVIESVSVFKQ